MTNLSLMIRLFSWLKGGEEYRNLSKEGNQEDEWLMIWME